MTDKIAKTKTGLVTFVGSGPGDPELLTIKGKKAIESADLVLYAGSLVSPEIINLARKDIDVYDTAVMTLEQIHALARDMAYSGGSVARIHSGDTSLYCALREQISLLDKDNIPWRVIPGITAVCAAAAAAGLSLTIPEISQSLIITRMAGRTPMPQEESIASLASHNTAMGIYLSGKQAEALQEKLAQSLPADTDVLCAHRVGWQEQKLVWCKVGNLGECVKKHKLERQTLFLVLPANMKEAPLSRLYAPDFSHEFRH